MLLVYVFIFLLCIFGVNAEDNTSAPTSLDVGYNTQLYGRTYDPATQSQIDKLNQTAIDACNAFANLDFTSGDMLTAYNDWEALTGATGPNDPSDTAYVQWLNEEPIAAYINPETDCTNAEQALQQFVNGLVLSSMDAASSTTTSDSIISTSPSQSVTIPSSIGTTSSSSVSGSSVSSQSSGTTASQTSTQPSTSPSSTSLGNDASRARGNYVVFGFLTFFIWML